MYGRTSSQPRVAMPGRFKLDDRVTCVRNNNAMGKRHAGTISKVRRTVRIIDGVSVPVHPAHSSMLHTGHQGRARPRLEPQQRLRRMSLLLGRRGDGRRLQARRHVVLLRKVRRRRGGAQSGPGADIPEQIMSTKGYMYNSGRPWRKPRAAALASGSDAPQVQARGFVTGPPSVHCFPSAT